MIHNKSLSEMGSQVPKLNRTACIQVPRSQCLMAEGNLEKRGSERGLLAERTAQAEGVRVFASGQRAPPLFCLYVGGAHDEKEVSCIPTMQSLQF